MKNLLFPLLFVAFSAHSQSTGPRLFVDVPAIYLRSLDVKNFADRVGLGGDFMMNVGTHYFVARAGGGAIVSLEPASDDLQESMLTSPYARLEVGVGPYRTNGNQCSNHHQNAFTAQARIGSLYDFKAKRVDFPLAAEFGYFFIKDMTRNTELFVRGDYYVKAETITLDFGMRFFLNLRH